MVQIRTKSSFRNCNGELLVCTDSVKLRIHQMMQSIVAAAFSQFFPKLVIQCKNHLDKLSATETITKWQFGCSPLPMMHLQNDALKAHYAMRRNPKAGEFCNRRGPFQDRGTCKFSRRKARADMHLQ